MRIKDLYPVSFDYSVKDFNSFMRSLLIKASYDALLKKETGYKGMYLNEEAHECWTLKFENFSGIFGLVLVLKEENIGEFKLFYFPSPDEAVVSKLSISEAYITQEKDYIDKVRAFSKYENLLTRFCIGTIYLHLNILSESFFLLYESNFKDKIYAKDGLKHPFNEDEMLLEKNEMDKNFPSLRYLLPFMNFLNSTVKFMMKSNPQIFEAYKSNANFLYYNENHHFYENMSKRKEKIYIVFGYGKDDIKSKFSKIINFENMKILAKSSIFHSLFKDGLCKNAKITLNQSDTIKPNLIVVTGFLGSGKTNFLQNYIEYETEKNRFVGIIQNEIGKTGLDGRLIDYDYSLVEMDEGCVCCSLSGQLKSGISTLMKKTVPDTILLETTGVANPFNLLSELNELENMINLESIVTVVDGANALEFFDKYKIFQDQIKAADIILLNKSDLINEDEIRKVIELIEATNRCASIIQTIKANIHPNRLRQYTNKTTSHISSLISEEEEEKRDHNYDKISSIKIDIHKPLNQNDLSKYLNSMPKNIFRIKGIVKFENKKNPFVVQYVNGRFEFLEQENPNKMQNFLIYIGQNLKKSFIISPVNSSV